MQAYPPELWWAFSVGSAILMVCAVGLIAIVLLYQRRFLAEHQIQIDEISKREQKYRNLFENSLAGMLRISLQEWKVLDANAAFLKMFRYESIEEVTDLLSDLLSPDLEALKHLLVANGYIENFEMPLRRKDGTLFWVSFSGRTFQNEGYVEGVVIDTTAAKQAEERIREQAALLDKAQDAIIVRDLEDFVLYWNKGAERLYGWKSDESAGRKVTELIYGGEPDGSLPQAREDVLKYGEWNGELHQTKKGGEDVVSASRWTLVRNPDGSPKSILMINTDITEKKRLESQFLRAQRMESIGVLAGGIAHDLNNILSPILISIDVLRRRVKDDLGQRTLSAIESSTKRGAEMIKHVLTFARGIEGERALLQPKQLISEVFKIATQAFPKSIEVRNTLPDDIWMIRGDATQLHQVFMNLFVNARDAMPRGGTLSVTAENTYLDENFSRMNPEAKAGPYVVLNVGDTGVGIPSVERDKIFEPFYTTKGIGKGTGLGLSTALGIVKSHGGFMIVASTINKGTTFHVYLPAVVQTAGPQPKDEGHDVPDGNGELILIIDDEAPILETAKAALENHGYKVLTAGDGAEAMSVYVKRSAEVRVVVTDMMMPHMGGVETIRALKRLDPEIKIIATTGLTMPEDMRVNQPEGVRAVLLKPFTSEKLLRTLHEVLEPEGRREQTAVTEQAPS